MSNAPLRRRPKVLSDSPTIFAPAAGANGGQVLRAGAAGHRRGQRTQVAPGGAVASHTDEQGETIALADLARTSDVDRVTRRRAQQIARRLAVARPPRERRAPRGVGELTSVRWHGGSDEIDLDATIEAAVGSPSPTNDDIVVRERMRIRRSIVLVVDVSGSMRGERIRTAAATVGALAGQFTRDELAVVAFWSDAAVLVRRGELVTPATVVDLLLQVPTRGLTNVSFALDVAARQLVGSPRRQSRVLLLSDCVHNAGPDPRTSADRLPRLDVLLDRSGENDLDLGRDLARRGRGRCRPVRGHRDVAPALGALFAI